MKPVRTAWQWHELYDYIECRLINELHKLINSNPDSPEFELINDAIETKYGMLLHKCKERMRVSK